MRRRGWSGRRHCCLGAAFTQQAAHKPYMLIEHAVAEGRFIPAAPARRRYPSRPPRQICLEWLAQASTPLRIVRAYPGKRALLALRQRLLVDPHSLLHATVHVTCLRLAPRESIGTMYLKRVSTVLINDCQEQMCIATSPVASVSCSDVEPMWRRRPNQAGSHCRPNMPQMGRAGERQALCQPRTGRPGLRTAHCGLTQSGG